jgi:hypothetical protein
MEKGNPINFIGWKEGMAKSEEFVITTVLLQIILQIMKLYK